MIVAATLVVALGSGPRSPTTPENAPGLHRGIARSMVARNLVRANEAKTFTPEWKFSEMARTTGDTFRAVYTMRFATAICVLHAFQKKSKSGTKSPAPEMEFIERRLKVAAADYKARNARGEKL